MTDERDRYEVDRAAPSAGGPHTEGQTRFQDGHLTNAKAEPSRSGVYLSCGWTLVSEGGVR